MANGVNPLLFNPYLQLGMGILGGNQGVSGSEAFSNAMRSGLQALNQAMVNQSLYSQMQREERKENRENEQFRAQQALAGIVGQGIGDPERGIPGYTPEAYREAVAAADPTAFAKAAAGQMFKQPDMTDEMRNFLFRQQLPAGMRQQFDVSRGEVPTQSPTGGGMTRGEVIKELNLGDYTQESVNRMMAAGAQTGTYDPRMLETPSPTYGFDEEQKFYADLDRQIAPIRSAVNSAERLAASLSRPGAISDVASVFGFMNVLDPRSIVTGAEQDLVNRAGSFWDQLQSIRARYETGETLPQAVREDMAGLIDSLIGVYEEQYNRATESAQYRAGQYPGINVQRILPRSPDFGAIRERLKPLLPTETEELPTGTLSADTMNRVEEQKRKFNIP